MDSCGTRNHRLHATVHRRGATGINGTVHLNGASALTSGAPVDETVSRILQNTIVDLVNTERAMLDGDTAAPAVVAMPADAIDGNVSESIAHGETISTSNLSGPCADYIPGWKRALDVACVLLTLPLWLPIMVVICAWIKLVSPGPIFYRQERIGYRQHPFMMFKFRTMHVNVASAVHESYLDQLIASDTPMTKLDSAGDPRLIRFARLIRAAGLDELPQLFNVLRGEMSLVGPRPCTRYEYARYNSSHHGRFNSPPGLTGYWQVNGKNKTTFSQMIAMDIFYTSNLSLRRDLQIILKTPYAIFNQVVEPRRSRPARVKPARMLQNFETFIRMGGNI